MHRFLTCIAGGAGLPPAIRSTLSTEIERSTMTLLRTIVPAAALAALAAAPALAAEVDVTKAESITCAPDRIARCKKDGDCEWKSASARDKEQLLVVDFKAKTASFMFKGKRRGGGLVLEDKMNGGSRAFVISKDETRNPRTTMELAIDKAGKMTGTRNAGRVKIEATCKAS